MSKVKDLVKHLLKGDQEAEVVAFGHFGEIVEVDIRDFWFRELKKGDSPQGITGSYLSVPIVDIGPEPT